MAIGPASPETARPAARFELAILAKAPIAGYAKTRLIPLLGAAGAARLQDWLIGRTVETARAAGFGQLTLWCAPDGAHPTFARCREHHGVALRSQPEGDLGARMLRAAQQGDGASGRAGVAIVGTDCPALTAGDLIGACRAVDAGADAALIPAEDGGYVLIALARPRAELFSGIDWGSPQVLAQTRRQAQAAGILLAELPPSWDVDRPDDWRRLLALHPELRRIVGPPARDAGAQ